MPTSIGMTIHRPRLLIPAQAAAGAIALAALALWPPAAGSLLLVPIGGGDAGTAASTALAGGAALLGAGPLPGSLRVVGDRSRIARAAKSWTMLILAAPASACGARAAVGSPA